MNYSQSIFGKAFREITIDDIATYFSEYKTESDSVEYKSLIPNTNWDTTINIVCKAICGFLNGSGGVLILGAPRGSKVDGRQEDIFVGAPTFTQNPKGPDWFINKISTEISPMPKDIQIQTLDSENGCLYIFNIPESTFKPHQFNSQYYIRLDGQIKPAPHYIVQALMREIKYPDIRGFIGFSIADVINGRLHIEIRVGLFNFSQNQNEQDVNYSILLTGAGFANSQVQHPIFTYTMQGARLYRRPMQDPLYYGMPITQRFDIIASPDADEINILLAFGGRKSPAKSSRYKLSLNNLRIDSVSTNLLESVENEPFIEVKSIDDTIEYFKNNRI